MKVNSISSWLAGFVVVMLTCGAVARGEDIPAPPQLPGQHSTIVTSDGPVLRPQRSTPAAWRATWSLFQAVPRLPGATGR